MIPSAAPVVRNMVLPLSNTVQDRRTQIYQNLWPRFKSPAHARKKKWVTRSGHPFKDSTKSHNQPRSNTLGSRIAAASHEGKPEASHAHEDNGSRLRNGKQHWRRCRRD